MTFDLVTVSVDINLHTKIVFINSNYSVNVNASVDNIAFNCLLLTENVPEPYYNQIKTQNWDELSHKILTLIHTQFGPSIITNVPLPPQISDLLKKLKISNINLVSSDDYISLKLNLG